MKKLYAYALLLAASFSLSANAEETIVKIAADITVEQGLHVFGPDYSEGSGDDRVDPLSKVEFEGYTIDFKIYEQPEMPPFNPTASRYFFPGSYKTPQFDVFSGNEFTVKAPEGAKMTSIEIALIDDCFRYGEVTADCGSIVCNGGESNVNASDRVPAKPYVWTAGNEDGFSSVTFSVAEKEFDGKADQQFFFASLSITALTSSSAVEAAAAAETVTVYGIDGTKVLDNAPAEAAASLSDGLYIINGKKIIIRQ